MSGWDSSKESGPVGKWGVMVAGRQQQEETQEAARHVRRWFPRFVRHRLRALHSSFLSCTQRQADQGRPGRREWERHIAAAGKAAEHSCNRWENPSKNPNLTRSLSNPHAPTHRRHTQRSSLRLLFKKLTAPSARARFFSLKCVQDLSFAIYNPCLFFLSVPCPSSRFASSFLGFSPTVHTLGTCFLFFSPFSYYTYYYVHSS